jgi:hypothetical protein
MLIYKDNFSNVIQGNNNTLWKIISMGLDLSYFDNIKLDNKELNQENISITKKIFFYFIYFILFSTFFGFYNSSIFGMILNPLYHNIIFMIIVIINIFINIKKLANKESSLFSFNVGYFIILFILILIIKIIIYYIS